MNIQNLKSIISTYLKDLDYLNHSYKYKPNILIFNKIKSIYPQVFISTAELIYLKRNKDNLENLHIFCPVCGKKNRFAGSKIGYQTYCSRKCNNNSIETRSKMSRSWKLTWNSKSEDDKNLIKQKIFNTKKNNGTLPNSQIVIEKFRNTMSNKTDEDRQIKKQKEYKTRIKNGTLANSIKVRQKFNETISKRTDEQRKIIKQKEYVTRKLNGTLPGNKISVEKFKDTMSRKTREEKDIIKLKIRETKKKNNTLESNDVIINKVKNTWKSKSREEIKLIYKKQLDSKRLHNTLPSNPTIINKVHSTKKKNGTLGGNRSKAEIRCYEKIKLKFSDSDYSYFEDKRYPFNCDIYIPSQDLFIECHFSKYHHYHPFDENCIGDLVELSRLNNIINSPYYKDSDKKQCIDIIYTWTRRDRLKLKTFQDNHLNYKIFYTEKEFNEWFNKIK